MCLYVINVNDKNVIKMSLLKMSNNSSFIKMSICDYFYFELNINKFNNVFLKMKIILRKSRISFSSKITRVF